MTCVSSTMSGLMRITRALKKEQSGQALVEFALVAPLFVMVLLFSLWLWELVAVRLKVQEMARYAAWEATAYRLHDYRGGEAALDSRFNAMRAGVSLESMVRYSNLNSAKLQGPGGGFLLTHWDQPQIGFGANCRGSVAAVAATLLSAGSSSASGKSALPRCGNEVEELVPAIGSGGNAALQLVAPLIAAGSTLLRSGTGSTGGRIHPNWVAESLLGINLALGAGGISFGASAQQVFGDPSWGFNSAGYIRAIAGVNIRNDWFNVHLFGKPLFPREPLRFVEHHGVLADSWRLHDGSDVLHDERSAEQAFAALGGTMSPTPAATPGLLASIFSGARQTRGSGYYAQVRRMYLSSSGTRRVMSGIVTAFYRTMNLAERWAGRITNGSGTGLGRRYLMRPALASLAYRGTRGEVLLKTDRSADTFDGGAERFDTAPRNGPYAATRAQRGPYFMGCPAAQQAGCVDTLAQGNPFGAFPRRP